MAIQEKYVSFEQSKKLIVLEFPQTFNRLYRFYYPTKKFEDENGDIINRVGEMQYDNDDGKGFAEERYRNLGYIACPTVALTVQWLRKEKNLLLYITPLYDSKLNIKYTYNIMDLKSGAMISLSDVYDDYDIALSAGLDSVLEKIVKKED